MHRRPLVVGMRLLGILLLAVPLLSGAYEHENSRVTFEEYTDDVVERNLDRQRPFFLLFSAEWCHWCHVFAEESLSREEVYTYLNEHFVNVFIDADIHNAAYAKYRANGLPYAVFLNPDGSIHFKYGGTLYGDDFVEVLRDIRQNIKRGVSIPGHAATLEPYVVPESLEIDDLAALGETFRRGVLEHFDPVYHGVGRGEKAVLPRTFLFLLDSADEGDREIAAAHVEDTLNRALTAIFDPVEGGFYRYAETRDWQIPHYEKMADLNAGAALVMNRLASQSPGQELANAARQTTQYLGSTLFDARVGAFLSFQEADTQYFLLDATSRADHQAPGVADKIFTDRLAGTLDFLMDLPADSVEPAVVSKVQRSLDFLAIMVEQHDSLQRFYRLDEDRWQGDSLLRDHALVARVFQKASRRFASSEYAAISQQVIDAAFERFFHTDKGIFIDPTLEEHDSVEYLMELNALLALSMMELATDAQSTRPAVLDGIMTYFSAIGVLLEDRLWESTDWELMEVYVPYLRAIDAYLPVVTAARQ